MSYQAFINQKLQFIPPSGIDAVTDIESLFPHQRDLVNWSLKRGRSAIFADTGLGKSRMQIAWADAVAKQTGGDILILAPLAVAAQTIDEGNQIGIGITHVHDDADIKPGINITNYDRLHKFDCSRFIGVVLDESSIIKHHDSKTLSALLAAFEKTPFKLCATATPAPNDFTELGTHAEFLGIRSRAEILAEFFVHDGGSTQTWRLKGHAKHDFWRWVASWGAMLRSPDDLGYDASMYQLPPLKIEQHTIKTDPLENGQLFAIEAQTLTERRIARKNSLEERVSQCAELVNSSDDVWVIWCDLNAEADALRESIPDAVEIRGSDTEAEKERRLHNFSAGKIRVLISKPKICGWGLNWQHCHHIAFVGVTDSFEAYYQAVRRCWRFGQKHPVNVHIFAADTEGAVVNNLRRKESDALAMAVNLTREVAGQVKANLRGTAKEQNDYRCSIPIRFPGFLRSVA